MENFISIFSSMTNGTRLHSRALSELTNIIKNNEGLQNEKVADSYVNMFKNFLSTNKDAATSLIGKLPDIFRNALVAADSGESIQKAHNNFQRRNRRDDQEDD